MTLLLVAGAVVNVAIAWANSAGSDEFKHGRVAALFDAQVHGMHVRISNLGRTPRFIKFEYVFSMTGRVPAAAGMTEFRPETKLGDHADQSVRQPLAELGLVPMKASEALVGLQMHTASMCR